MINEQHESKPIIAPIKIFKNLNPIINSKANITKESKIVKNTPTINGSPNSILNAIAEANTALNHIK